MTSSLPLALANAIRGALERSSDSVVRVAASRSWPIGESVQQLQVWFPNLIVGLVEPLSRASLDPSPTTLICDSAELTQIRNGRATASLPLAPLVIFGEATGRQEAGLRRIHATVQLSGVVESWESWFRDSTECFEGPNRDLRRQIGTVVFEWVRDGRLRPSAAAGLVDAMVIPDSELADIQRQLHLVDLMPDTGLIGSHSIRARLSANRDTLDRLLGGDAAREVSRLRRSGRAEATELADWLRTRQSESLRRSDYRVAKEVLGERETVPPPTNGSRPLSLLEVLSRREVDLSRRQGLLDQVVDTLPEDFVFLGEFDEEVEFDDLRIGMSFKSLKPDARRYVNASTAQEGVTSTLEDTEVFFVEVGEEGALVPLADTALAALLPLASSERVQKFVEARRALLRASRALSLRDDQLLEVLVASPTLRQLGQSYVTAWMDLLAASTEPAPVLPLIDGTWVRELLATEDPSTVSIVWDVSYHECRLAPWHPWRLSPLLSLAEHIVGQIATDVEAVGSAVWALDRAVPAYRLLNAGNGVLEYRYSRDGEMIFDAGAGDSLPALYGRARGLVRALEAYAQTHPWASVGTTLTVCNPPRGGAVAAALEAVADRFGERPPAIVLMRTANMRGLEQLDDVDGLVATREVERLSDWPEESQFAQDVAIAFVRGPLSHSGGLRRGSHSSIEVRLESQSVTLAGQERYEPLIQVSASADNSLVRLVYSAAGRDVDSARFNLNLSTADRIQLEALLSRSGWLVVCVPGTVSAFDLHLPDGSTCPRIAEFDEGGYRCLVFAPDISPIEWKIRDLVQELPLPPLQRESLRQALSGIAQSQPQKLFDVAINPLGPKEALGVIGARAVARASATPGSLVLEVSLDDSSWTRDWLEADGRRADFLLVEVSGDADIDCPITFTVVEAKATAAEFEHPNPSRDPFAEAVTQVEATKAQLEVLLDVKSAGLLSRLRFRALTEQLAGLAAYQYAASQDRERFETYFAHLSAFAEQGQAKVQRIRGIAVAIYLTGLQPTERLQLGEDLELVSGSGQLLSDALRGLPLVVTDVQSGAGATEATEPTLPISLNPQGMHKPADQSRGPHKEVAAVVDGTGEVTTPVDLDSVPSIGAAEEALVDNLMTALALRTSDVGAASSVRLQMGPTFMAVSVDFMRGATLQPLQRAERDIARDLGVAAVEVSNASEQGRIQVLLPRRERIFPSLPRGSQRPSDVTHEYLDIALGQDLAGVDYYSQISQWPHALVAGSTGSGKTTFMRNMLRQVGDRRTQGVRAVVVDGKGESDYLGVLPPDAFAAEFPQPIPDMHQAVDVLRWLREEEIPRRRALINQLAADHGRRMDARLVYADALAEGHSPTISPLLVVIDEFNELMLQAGTARQQFTDGVTSIAQIARSVMVHLVLCTQLPNRTVLPGVIKTNLNVKIAFRLGSPSDSVIVLGRGGAERLLGRGDMIVQSPGMPDIRLQGYRD